MLTININDVHLEKRIAEKARSIGKSMQEIVEELLTKGLPEKSESSDLNYEILDPEKYGYYITGHGENISADEGQELFSHVQDTEKYVEDLRKKAWRKP